MFFSGRVPADQRPYSEALVAITHGWKVIPLHSIIDGACSCRRPVCSSPGKHPLSRGWPERGSFDITKVTEMFTTDLGLVPDGSPNQRIPVAPPTMPNLGISTGTASGIVVLDIDPRNGGDEELEWLEDRHGRLPETVVVLSGGGGQHHYFRPPRNLVLPSGPLDADHHPGVDLKAERGFVVGPGSLHASGRHYEWELSSHPDDVELAELPQWVVGQALKRVKKPRSAFYHSRERSRPGTPEQQERFKGLWAGVGIHLDPSRQAMYVCPFHDDHDPSLNIHPVNCVFFCFGCGTGGGLRVLEGLMSQQSVMKKGSTTDCWDIRGLPDPSTWAEPAPPTQRCEGPRQLHRHRERRTRHRGLQVLWGDWDCYVCGPYLKEDWYGHLQLTLLGTDGHFELVLCTPSEWDTVRHAIDRDRTGRVDYAHFDLDGTAAPLGDTTQVVITTSTGIGQPIASREAVRLVRHLIRSLPFDGKRLSTSEAWEKAKVKGERTGDWENRDRITCSLAESAAGAKKWGLDPTRIRPLKGRATPPWGQGYEVDIPDSMRPTTFVGAVAMWDICDGEEAS